MPIAFQPGVFQRDSFQTFTRRASARIKTSHASFSVLVRTEAPIVRAGSENYVQVHVVDDTVQPALKLDPSAGVKTTIKNPAGTVIVNAASMTKEEVGIYSYLYQSQTTDVKGGWTGEFKVENEGHIVITVPVQIFVLT